MPTGYTAKICQGEQSFEDFVWSCAKAFGAFINQRDDAVDAPPILNEQPSEHEQKCLDEARENLAALNLLSDEEWRAKYATAKAEGEEYNRQQEARTAAVRNRLEAMIAKVERWVPPTSEHEGLKEFMRDQLNRTIACDAYYTRFTGFPDFDSWKHKTIEQAIDSVKYYSKALQEEIKRVNGRNAWKRALLESVPLPQQ